MGDKVSKMKNAINRNLVKVVEFDESTKGISTKDVIDMYYVLVTSGNTSVSVFQFSGESLLTDSVAQQIFATLQNYNTRTVVAPTVAALDSQQVKQHFLTPDSNSNNNNGSNSNELLSSSPSNKSPRRKLSNTPSPLTTAKEIKKRERASLALRFQHSDFSSEGVNHLFQVIAVCDFINELYIDGNYKTLEMGCIDTLERILLKSSRSSSSSSSSSGGGGDDDNEGGPSLQKLHLGGFGISQQIASRFMSLMCKQRHIVELSLDRWQISPLLLRKLLLDSQQQNEESSCVFRVLELTNCEINNECCKVLAQALKTNTRLERIVLRKNKISDVGVNHLIGGVEEMSPQSVLQWIDLEENEVDMDSATVKALNSLLRRDDEKERALVRDPSLRLMITKSTTGGNNSDHHRDSGSHKRRSLNDTSSSTDGIFGSAPDHSESTLSSSLSNRNSRNLLEFL